MKKENREEWSSVKNDYAALITARLANSIITDYERLAGDIAEQQEKYSYIYNQNEIIHYLEQMDVAIQILHTARFRLFHMLHRGNDNDFIYDIRPDSVVKMQGRVVYEDEDEKEDTNNDLD